jgi:ketosteroid isomerase-like protein
MKIRFLVALVGLAVSFASPTFAQQKDTVDPKIAQRIRALETKFDEAFNKNDAAAVAALYTEDAFYGTPHGGFHGRQSKKIMQDTLSRITIPTTFSSRSIGQLRLAMRSVRSEDGV